MFTSRKADRTFRNVRYSVAIGCKPDIEQAAFSTLEL
jgi:hypothetical protein